VGGVKKKRPVLTPFHSTSIFQDVEIPQKTWKFHFCGAVSAG
jgi:hypothetical protein